MVGSQVHSQYPSRISFSSMQQHRSWLPSNADLHCQESETSEAFGSSNTTPDGHFLSFNGYVCPGPVDKSSPFNSSWIQRLIPSQNTRVEQAQLSDKLDRDNYGIDGSHSYWNESADHLKYQSDIPVYENSRRSKQDFFSSKVYRGGKLPAACMGNGVSVRHFEVPDALPPEIQVLPKPLPVVESLLPGCSEKAQEKQIFPETNRPHVVSLSSGFAKPMNETVLYTAYEKSRVCCTSIEELNCCSVVGAAGDSFTLKALQQGNRRSDPLQPCSELSFKSNDAVTSDVDTIYSVENKQRGTNLRTHKNSTQTEGSFVTLVNKNRRFDSNNCWAFSLPRGQAVESRPFDGHSAPNNCWNSKEHSSYALDGSEALHSRKGSFDGGQRSFPCKEKDDLWQVSNLVPVQCESNVVKETAGIYLPHQTIEQDLGSSHEEQGGTSRSFSFHFENGLAPEDYSKVVMRIGQWPFGPSILSSQNLGQSRLSEDNRAKGLVDVTTLGTPHDSVFFFQEPGVHETGSDCIGRIQSLPFFGTKKLNDSSSCDVFNNHDISPHKAARTIEALPATGVDHSMKTLKGGPPLSTRESNSMVEGVEGKELSWGFPLFKPSSHHSTPSYPSEVAQSNHADSNCVSVNHWQGHRPLIRGSSHTGPHHESTQLNVVDGNLCSIGSCSKRPLNYWSEDGSTSAKAKSLPFALETSVSSQEQLPGSQQHRAINKVNSASGDQESHGKEATSWDASGSGTKENIWMKRWSTLKSRKVQAVSGPNGEGGVFAGSTHARNYIEDHYTLQASGDISGRFNVWPAAKRFCLEERSRLHSELGTAVSNSGLVVAGKENNDQSAASHFMKRFFTPSVAAMAIMGRTARKVNDTQPQKSGLFGIWALNASLRKPSGACAEACKEFATMMDCKKEIAQFAAMAPSAQEEL